MTSAFKMKGFPKHKTKNQDKLTAKQKQDRIGEPIMKAPYKKPNLGPKEKPYPRDGSIKGFKTTEPESYGAGHKKVMKDGPKNRVHGVDLGKDPHWRPNQFKPKKSTTTAHGQLNDAQAEYEADKKLYKKNKKASPNKSWDAVKEVGKKVYNKAKSKVAGKVVSKGLKKVGAKAAARAVPGVGQAVMLAEGTKAVFDGYGKMGKTKTGRQIIKDSGVGRTRKI